MLSHAEIMALRREVRFEWSRKDTMLYALGIGMPSDPLDERELAFVYEPRQAAMPSFVVTPAFNDGLGDLIGYDYSQVLHGEHAFTLHRPVPVEGRGTARLRMLEAWDKGQGKGAVFAHETLLTLDGDDTPFARVVTTAFARADGGFGGSTAPQPAPHAVPTRAPDRTVEIATHRNQALLYRQSGDANPLHADPETARRAGFSQPILHGLCSYAICLRAVMASYCDHDPARVHHHAVRFSAPVFPGETLLVDLWRDDDIVSFEARVKERGVTVIRNGKTVLKQAERC
ncbi:MaoC/PaaZ C-terminal domain-containing protein [Sphingomonas colocasiae]|uniref:3-alpha,7-alpha, 12-alpha-trihydroxy-5-beta-cholest-24-enoyl-CoA hydratase n=1 Tax=Sphingomonas colocasiae TaxID=1848973 RepID=A0ABS7PSN8_9SPHN|nr:MaoC/PaaZ C-terminal domain-containing protein [Sphingomonas colocasiae]MBY8824308.1 hypothetical protein [Sphingomonas colocasiae]